jgi:threonine dehydrogenase-like Zn-dependent dehydrogenase
VSGDITIHDPEFHRREITLLASRNATADDFARVIDEVEKGAVRPERWITHRVALEDVPRRFAALPGEPSLVKAVIEIG